MYFFILLEHELFHRIAMFISRFNQLTNFLIILHRYVHRKYELQKQFLVTYKDLFPTDIISLPPKIEFTVRYTRQITALILSQYIGLS